MILESETTREEELTQSKLISELEDFSKEI